MKNKFISYLFLTIFMINVGFSSIFISGLDYPKSIDVNSEIFYFNTTLINSENEVYSNLILKYSLVDLDNLGLVYENSDKLSFDNNEVKIISKNFELPDLSSGNYAFNLIVTENTGAPIAGMKYDIELTNSGSNLNLPELIFEKSPHMLATDKNGEIIQKSYGSLGNNIPQDANKFVEFTLKNPQNLELETKIELFNSYSIENKLKEFNQNLNLKSNQDTYTLDLDYTIPGTYIVKTSFYNQGSKLFSKELRMVIAGESASIVSLLNKKDTYTSGENIQITGTLVGPADGRATLKNLKLNLQVSQNSETLIETSQTISQLGFEPVEFDFTQKTNFDLTKYKVKVTLTNLENNLLDEIELDYEKLEAEYLYKEGTIYKADFQGCFNNDVCEDFEQTLGNCYDCDKAKQQAITQEKQRYKDSLKNDSNQTIINNEDKQNAIKNFTYILTITVILLLFVIVIGYFVLRGIKKNE